MNDYEKKLQNGYIRIPNEVYETVYRARVPGYIKDVLSALIRLSWGWGKEKIAISNIELAEETGLNRTRVIYALNFLEKYGVIKRVYITQKIRFITIEPFSMWRLPSRKGRLSATNAEGSPIGDQKQDISRLSATNKGEQGSPIGDRDSRLSATVNPPEPLEDNRDSEPKYNNKDNNIFFKDNNIKNNSSSSQIESLNEGDKDIKNQDQDKEGYVSGDVVNEGHVSEDVRTTSLETQHIPPSNSQLQPYRESPEKKPGQEDEPLIFKEKLPLELQKRIEAITGKIKLEKKAPKWGKCPRCGTEGELYSSGLCRKCTIEAILEKKKNGA